MDAETPTSGIDPLAVKPKRACVLLDCGNTHLYELIGRGELESFKDGKSRKILVASIRGYIERRMTQGTGK